MLNVNEWMKQIPNIFCLLILEIVRSFDILLNDLIVEILIFDEIEFETIEFLDCNW